jgi:hypothetical protein
VSESGSGGLVDLKNVRKGSLIFSPPDIGENCFLVVSTRCEQVNIVSDAFVDEYAFSGIWLTQKPPQKFFSTTLYFSFTTMGTAHGWLFRSF